MWYYQHSDELYHHGIKGMKWGVRRFQKNDGTLTSAGKKRYFEKSDGLYSKFKPPKNAMDGEGLSSKTKKFPGSVVNIRSAGKTKRPGLTTERQQELKKTIDESIRKVSKTEIAKRGKSAFDVLMNGDKDWMGNSTYSDDVGTELRNRGKAAIERLMYSQEQIDNKKFFGRYDF